MESNAPESSGFFVPPELCNEYQLFFLTCVYGYILYIGSGLISDGSELLLLVPAIAGMVGSVVLPILGAVPDTLMVLFSGMGENVQEKVSVGVGALAGSTIMLLTVPWFFAVFGGRVDIDPTSGHPQYSRPRESKLSAANSFSLRLSGVYSSSQVRHNAVFMMVSALLYMFVQLPAMIAGEDHVSTFALIGCIVALGSGFYYVYLQYKVSANADSVVEEMVTEARVGGIRAGEVSLLGAMQSLLDQDVSNRESLVLPLVHIPESLVRQLRSILSPFFKQYQGPTGTIGFEQFITLMRDLRQGNLSMSELVNIFNTADVDSSGTIEFEEFVQLMLTFIRDFDVFVDTKRYYRRTRTTTPELSRANTDDLIMAEEANSNESEDMPEDLENLTPEEQQRRIKFRSLCMMGLGTLLVLLFTDPAVDVMAEVAKRTNVNPFFVSFILSPLASNASEVIASYNYSLKKTKRAMKVAFTTLEGAACMNNTLCLSVFLGVIYFQNLSWVYTAETVAIVFVQMTVGYMALKKHVFRLLDGLIILGLYPASLLIVEGLKLMGIQ
jgi:Ca2+/H+ antiporter